MSGISSTTLKSLQEKNPFTSNAAAVPWSNNFPDVASINRHVFEEILALIKSKAVSPQMPLAGLILGEAGDGKTHLLWRILDACKKSEPPSLFVFVKPLFNSNRPFHHLLQEIVLSLSKKNEGESGFSQFERLVAEIIRDYVRYRVTSNPKDATPQNRLFLEQFEADVFHIFTKSRKIRVNNTMEIIEKKAVHYLHSQVPETNKQFLDVVFQYKSPDKQGLVRDWLKGSVLDEDDCEKLGVPSRAQLSDEANEQEARDMILTLGTLLARYHLPMVLCFDQWDNLTKPELIAGFANMIHLLVNDAANMLPLAFIRGDSWNERFQKGPDRAFVDRMESNKLVLRVCTKEEAGMLISRRIEKIFGEGTKEAVAIEKWLLPQVESKLSGSNSPREVILLANRTIRDASEPSVASPSASPSASMDAEYKKACDAVAVDFETWDPESEYLKKAAELFLSHQENVLSCQPGTDKFMTWTGTLKAPMAEVPYACFINTTKNAGAVLAALNRCKTFLQEHPHGICTYITDARCGFKPTWNITNERRREVESLGCNIVTLEQPAAVRWYGLASLSLKIGSGDILLEDGHGLRTATDKDLAVFLKTEFAACATEAALDRMTKKKGMTPPDSEPKMLTPSPSPGTLIPAVRRCLMESALPVLTMEVLLSKLREKGIDICLEWCLEQIGKNQNVFSLLPIGNGYMVALVA